MAYTKSQFKRRRRKSGTKKPALPQLTKNQQQVMFDVYEGQRVVAADRNGKTLSSLEVNVGRGYIQIVEGIVTLTPAGEKWVKQRKKNKRARRVLEIQFEKAWKQYADPHIRVFFDMGNTKEVQIFPHDNRAFDVVFPEYMIAVEIQGGIFNDGAHVRGVQYNRDVQKKRDALALGWHTIELTTTDLKKNARKATVEMVMSILEGRKNHVVIELLQFATLAVCDETVILLDDDFGRICRIARDSSLYAPVLNKILDTYLIMREFDTCFSYRRRFAGSPDNTTGQRERFIARFGQYEGGTL